MIQETERRKFIPASFLEPGWLGEKSFLKWGLESVKTFSAWDPRLRVLNTYYYFGKRARSLSRKVRLVGILSDVLKIQYMVHLIMGEG